MKPLYTAYTALTSGIFIVWLPLFWAYTRLSGRYRIGLKERLGLIPFDRIDSLNGSPRIWLQAVSLGEIRVAVPVIDAIRKIIPDCSIILSTTTEHGRDFAGSTFKDDVPVIYAPIDFIFSVRKALSRVHPDVMVFLETEIWPAWLAEAQRMGIKTAIVNGRISERSIGGYLRFRPFFRDALKKVDVCSMILENDAARIRDLGADPGKIKVNGNAKYDLLSGQADPVMETEMRQLLNLQPSDSVFIAGSTRRGEEIMVLKAYEIIRRHFPDMILIIAPRHVDRAPVIESLIEAHGYNCQLRSGLNDPSVKRTESIVIMDTFGELFKLYSVGTIIFCGASLIPMGGQNPFEAAVWGKAVFYGPSMEDFMDVKTILENVGAGITVFDHESLADRAIWALNHPDTMKECGARARDAVMNHKGAAEKHAAAIVQLL